MLRCPDGNGPRWATETISIGLAVIMYQVHAFGVSDAL